MNIIDNLKLKLQIDSSDTSQDKILELFLIDTIKQISLYLEVDVFPEELLFIAEDISVKKYRRLGNEGVTTEKIDVISTTYQKDTDYLNEYLPYLKTYKANIKGTNRLRLL